MNRNRTKTRILSAVMTLSLLVGILFCLPFNAGGLYYNDGHKLSRAITQEGLVLLKNENNTIRWNIDLTDRFGVENYPFGSDATLSLQCAGRENTEEEPQVEIKSDKPVTVEIFWDGGNRSKTITAGGK